MRYHLSDIPERRRQDAGSSRSAATAPTAQAQLDLDDAQGGCRRVEVAAVCQCSGNRRGLFEPHVPGVEWGYGAMGCARWKGVRLKDVLDKVGLKKEAIEIVFDGADGPALDKTPDFVKSIPVWKAIEETTIIAYEMNGAAAAALQRLSGAHRRARAGPATYWMKHVVSINAVTKPFDGFWMKSAYRIPVGKFPLVARFISQETAANTPITEMVVNSLITTPRRRRRREGRRPRQRRRHRLGRRLRHPRASRSRPTAARPGGGDAGPGPRPLRVPHLELRVHAARGRYTVMARATNAIGQTQTAALILNPAGYHHNVMHRVTLDVA